MKGICSVALGVRASDFWPNGEWALTSSSIRWKWIGMPRIPPQTLKATFYLYPSLAAAVKGEGFGGTGFLVGKTLAANKTRCVVYAVTNWHVAPLGAPVIRFNTKDGQTAYAEFGVDEWCFPTMGHDIAIVPCPINQDVLDVSLIMTDMFIDDEKIKERNVGPGEDVFMAGRFIDADGGETNQPAARFGNISLMPVPLKQENGAKQKSFCVDMHSRSGFSGSPVFVYRKPGQDLTHGNLNMTDQFLYLLGIHWGQFPELWEVVQHQKTGAAPPESHVSLDGKGVKGMSGMTCVAPASAILNFINTHPKLVAFYEAANEYEANTVDTSKPIGEASVSPASQDVPVQQAPPGSL